MKKNTRKLSNTVQKKVRQENQTKITDNSSPILEITQNEQPSNKRMRQTMQLENDIENEQDEDKQDEDEQQPLGTIIHVDISNKKSHLIS